MKFRNLYKRIFALIFLCSFFMQAGSVQAAINKEINYQGKLTGASNVAVADGIYEIVFTLNDQLTGGSVLWTETDNVQVTNGLFSVMLGSTTPLTGIDFNQTLYLGVNIESDGEMSPRKIIGTVPAAFVADTVDNLSSEQFLRSDAQNATSSSSTFFEYSTDRRWKSRGIFWRCFANCSNTSFKWQCWNWNFDAVCQAFS